jgi:hypothetical protein
MLIGIKKIVDSSSVRGEDRRGRSRTRVGIIDSVMLSKNQDENKDYLNSSSFIKKKKKQNL